MAESIYNVKETFPSERVTSTYFHPARFEMQRDSMSMLINVPQILQIQLNLLAFLLRPSALLSPDFFLSER